MIMPAGARGAAKMLQPTMAAGAEGRTFSTELDFVRAEHTDLRGSRFNPAGRAHTEKAELRERVFA